MSVECPASCYNRRKHHVYRAYMLGGFSGRFGGYGYGYGHGGIGVIGVILIILVVLLLTGRL